MYLHYSKSQNSNNSYVDKRNIFLSPLKCLSFKLGVYNDENSIKNKECFKDSQSCIIAFYIM